MSDKLRAVDIVRDMPHLPESEMGAEWQIALLAVCAQKLGCLVALEKIAGIDSPQPRPESGKTGGEGDE